MGLAVALKLLELIRHELNVHKSDIHRDGSPIEEKRSLATVVTKIDEAIMWLDRYLRLRAERGDEREHLWRPGDPVHIADRMDFELRHTHL